jgi:tRNA A37 N6-isopentenylltransferase MiaA
MSESLSDRLKKNAKRKQKEELARLDQERLNSRTPEEIERAERLSEIRRAAGAKGHATQRYLNQKHEARREQERLRQAYKREQELENLDKLLDAASKLDKSPLPWEKSSYVEVEVTEDVNEPSLEELVKKLKEEDDFKPE